MTQEPPSPMKQPLSLSGIHYIRPVLPTYKHKVNLTLVPHLTSNEPLVPLQIYLDSCVEYNHPLSLWASCLSVGLIFNVKSPSFSLINSMCPSSTQAGWWRTQNDYLWMVILGMESKVNQMVRQWSDLQGTKLHVLIIIKLWKLG